MNTHFSVIMPTYNQASFIRRAILSLQRQTYPNWELIIINDGCTDDTEMFISDFLNDERIVYIKNESNKGLGHALNQGLDVAKYEYIAYLPSDDYYLQQVEMGNWKYYKDVAAESAGDMITDPDNHSSQPYEQDATERGYNFLYGQGFY